MPREVGLIMNGDFDSADFSILTAKSSHCCVISIILMRSGPSDLGVEGRGARTRPQISFTSIQNIAGAVILILLCCT